MAGPSWGPSGRSVATALGIRASLAGQRVLFATATQWVARLGDAKRQGSLETELKRLSFVPLLVVDLGPYRDDADMAATSRARGAARGSSSRPTIAAPRPTKRNR